MSVTGKLTQLYFDFVYNPTYDFTTAKIPSYHRLQRACVDKFDFKPGDKVLCVGIGTGNEIVPILERNGQVEIVGVDTSPRALGRAYRKAAKQGKEIRLFRMDASNLEFDDETFDKVFCFHVMDFVEDSHGVAAEMLRVLKRKGQFVLTFPSAREGLTIGANILGESLRLSSNKYKTLLGFLAMFAIAGIVYLPLLLRGNQRSYSLPELEAMFAGLAVEDFRLEEDAIYRDFIVYGRR